MEKLLDTPQTHHIPFLSCTSPIPDTWSVERLPLHTSLELHVIFHAIPCVWFIAGKSMYGRKSFEQ